MSDASPEKDIQQLVATIDKDPDPLHVDITPSVRQLSTLGLPAARAVLTLLDEPSQATRMRAFAVLGNVVMRRHGWEPGRGYADSAQDDEAQRLMVANGDYRVNAAPNTRQESIARWAKWLDKELADE